ncbi:MAG TPA: phosphate/phosphite/phosphonate ABC transporter substrate-binding protein [Candidatus Limnocylindria bacterium]|nr:phosphate/phosphite/phosphonate ABC transporter substrate-binding protein [Candidatus Limnocylindria bacterium]
MNRRSWAALAAAAAVMLAACGQPPASSQPSAAPQSKITIAVQPTATPEQLSANAKELDDFLTQKMAREVELVFPTTYAGVVEALRFGHAQAAFMSAWPARLAWKIADADVGLAEIREVVIGQEKKEETFYFSYWVVPKDSTATKLEDLRGKRVAFPSQLSTSGYVAPLARLVELGLVTKPAAGKEADPKTFFGQVAFAGGYQQGWEALKAGQVDVAIIAGDVSESLYREVLNGTKVIEQQGPVPSHSVVFAKQLDAQTKQQLKDALLELNNTQHRPLMRRFISGIFVGFKPTTAETHLASLAKYLDTTQLAFVESIR